tara:strand:- start:535 stop:969 length:435 start_codon:yes stop_codon:yes gene_type:complete
LKKIVVYTDGSCLGNPGPGGWGVLLIYNDHKKQLSGSMSDTTNNQMELTAAIEALKSLKEPCEVILHTDSQYVKNGITTWLKNWEKNGFKTANKKNVKNKELWILLDKYAKKHKVLWEWVKAHNGNEYNELVDELARNAATKIR